METLIYGMPVAEHKVQMGVKLRAESCKTRVLWLEDAHFGDIDLEV